MPTVHQREAQILTSKSKKERKDMFEFTIPDWIEATNMLDFNSARAQKIHRSIFELFIVDLVPFTEVNKPGFLRHHALLAPNFELASDKYYRSLLNPTYERIKKVIREKINHDSPPIFALGLDPWSQFHNGYLGVNAHYINDEWKRIIFCLSCVPFDERHTAENIYKNLTTVLTEWDMKEKIGLCLRDNAANMKATFKLPESTLHDAGCLAHTLQLVIKQDCFGLKTVADLLSKCSKLVTFANHSTNFYTELYEQQRITMGIDNKANLKSLKQDVNTRWNSTYYQLESIYVLQPALVQTLNTVEGADVEFSKSEWTTMRKVLGILKPFEEATQWLQCHDASISMAIPIVTTIILSLDEETADDHGVLTMKRSLKKGMLSRFPTMEEKEHYILATLLDTKFKRFFFREENTFYRAKAILTHSLRDATSTLAQDTPAPTTTGRTVLQGVMSRIISRKQGSAGDLETDSFMRSANKAVDHYLNLPLDPLDIDQKSTSNTTFMFWKNYSETGDRAQKSLSALARIYLTPAPTSSDVERLGSEPSVKYHRP